MKLTKKLKKVIALSVLGMTATALLGIASTEIIKTETSTQSGSNAITEDYMLDNSAEALQEQLGQLVNSNEGLNIVAKTAKTAKTDNKVVRQNNIAKPRTCFSEIIS